MERDKITPVAAPVYEAAPPYVAMPLESRSARPINLESNAPAGHDNDLTANRTWLVRIFAVRTDTLNEAERQMRAAGLMFALLGTLGIATMVGALIALYLETK